MAITLEQAKALKPGDKVEMCTYIDGQPVYTPWEVVEPSMAQMFPDPTIVCYLRGGLTGLPGYVFSDQLERYYIRGKG